MNTKDDETSLHKAAKTRQVEYVRKLLYESDCDPNTINEYGKTAAFMYFINLLNKANDYGSDDCLTNDEITCFLELLWFTYPQTLLENQVHEIFDMIDYCYQFSDVPIRKLYMGIVDVFMPRQYFVQKILNTRLYSDYCLIALMFEMNELLNDANFFNLRSNFLRELFTLFVADESFFAEYLSEVMGTGWMFIVQDQTSAFCALLTKQQSIPTIFSFVKCLIQYEIDFANFLKKCRVHLPPALADNLLVNIFVPLSNFINGPIGLSWTLRPSKQKKFSYYNFNETEDVLSDFNILVKRKSNFTQVVSLKNLSRMTVRKYVFQKYSHYKALSILYSLNIPIILRNFLCYNYCNLSF